MIDRVYSAVGVSGVGTSLGTGGWWGVEVEPQEHEECHEQDDAEVAEEIEAFVVIHRRALRSLRSAFR